MDDNDKEMMTTAIKHAVELRRKRQEILALPPEKALDAVLNAPQPAALVHSFPKEDLFFLIHDIGPDDALPLLNLASKEQWEYILDLEAWNKDRIDIQSSTVWLYRLLKADPERLVRWSYEENHEFIELYLLRNIEVRIREYDQDGTMFGDDFMTDDDTFYVRFLDQPQGDEKEKIYAALRNDFLENFLRRLSIYDHVRYQQLLLESTVLLPAETEENIFRMRSVRLAEQGFLPFDEAVGVYQPMKASEAKPRNLRIRRKEKIKAPWIPVPMYTAGMLREENHFTRSLTKVEDQEMLFLLQSEFAALANQVIAADQQPVRDRQALEIIVKKVSGYLSIGLEEITGGKPEPEATSRLLEDLILSNIFRVGYGCALSLKWKAEKWRKRSWFESVGLPLSFWGEEWLGVLGGLLIKKPKYFDNYRHGELYREFITMQEIQTTDAVLNEIIAFDDLLSLLNIKLKSLQSYRFLSYKNLILTCWAGDFLKIRPLNGEPAPIPMERFKELHSRLWAHGKPPRKIDDDIKENFLSWLSKDTGLEAIEISERLGKTLDDLFKEIEAELGSVETKYLDARYIGLFLVGKRDGN